jgi:hypothetical protein
MSLILAIEPDRRQVAHLMAIVRQVKGAELVLADTTERALESIGNNVPDLILVPALLSPQDDAALAAALRVIATAAHVQMVTIPTFATPKPAARRGVLSAFRRKPAVEAPISGCDPKVFAEEIASYLERANEQRVQAQLYEDEQASYQAETMPPPAPALTVDETPVDFEAAATTTEFVDTWAPAPASASQAYKAPPITTPTYADAMSAAPVFNEPGVEAVPDEPIYTPLVDAQDAEPIYAPSIDVQHAAPLTAAPHADPQDAEPIYAPSIDVQHAPPLTAAPHADPQATDEPPAFDELLDVEQRHPFEPEPVADAAYAYLADHAPVPVEPSTPAAPVVLDERTRLPEMPLAAMAVADMALDEFAATLANASPEVVESELPVALVSPSPVEDAHAPAFEDLLAHFERANLPVIQEVHAEQWMSGTVDQAGDAHALFEDSEPLDIDLSIELDAVLDADAATAAEPAAPALKPFEPVIPVDPADPLPLEAWRDWPQLKWSISDVPTGNGNGNGNGNGHHKPDDFKYAKFVEIAEPEDAPTAEEPLERFEPAVPREPFEPMPLAAWQCWPKLEGVPLEARQEPIAPRTKVAKPEWVELMRSLREDIARRRAELATSAPVPPPAPQPQPAKAITPRAESPKSAPAPAPAPEPAPPDPAKKRPKRTRPVEDEWGLFDPEQCGFAALLDKLDEITVAAATQNVPPRRSSR